MIKRAELETDATQGNVVMTTELPAPIRTNRRVQYENGLTTSSQPSETSV